MKSIALTASTLAAAALVWHAVPSFAETARRVPAPTADLVAPAAAKTETAVFAGGCFWGVQGVFQRVKGVSNAVSGYAGGEGKTAHYEEVGSGRTGHAAGNPDARSRSAPARAAWPTCRAAGPRRIRSPRS
jgi:peptide-methionine (S)-S-oxide reductase